MKKSLTALAIVSLLLVSTAGSAMALCRSHDAVSADPGTPDILNPLELVVNVAVRATNLIYHTVPKCHEAPDAHTDAFTRGNEAAHAAEAEHGAAIPEDN